MSASSRTIRSGRRSSTGASVARMPYSVCPVTLRVCSGETDVHNLDIKPFVFRNGRYILDEIGGQDCVIGCGAGVDQYGCSVTRPCTTPVRSHPRFHFNRPPCHSTPHFLTLRRIIKSKTTTLVKHASDCIAKHARRTKEAICAQHI